MKEKLVKLIREEEGQGMIEYALIIGLISVVAIASLLLLGPQITRLFDKAKTALTGA